MMRSTPLPPRSFLTRDQVEVTIFFSSALKDILLHQTNVKYNKNRFSGQNSQLLRDVLTLIDFIS